MSDVNEQLAEVAKATQEVAKTGRAAIEASGKIGAFLAKVLGEPIEQAVGLLSDRLKFMRWERQVRLCDRAREILIQRGYLETKPVLPKIAIPLIEFATLEESNELQDLWAELLVTAMAPDPAAGFRSAFIDLVRQMEVIDAKLLQYVSLSFSEAKTKSRDPHPVWESPTQFAVNAEEIRTQLHITEAQFEESADNLIRLRCIASFIESSDTWMVISGQVQMKTVSGTFVYSKVCITTLGLAFTKACMPNFPHAF